MIVRSKPTHLMLQGRTPPVHMDRWMAPLSEVQVNLPYPLRADLKRGCGIGHAFIAHTTLSALIG